MAEPLKNYFGPDVVHRIAAALAGVGSDFDVAGFTADCLEGFDDLELTARGHHIASAMATHLPSDRTRAIDLLIASFGPELENCDPAEAAPAEVAASVGGAAASVNLIAGFFYMPHAFFVAAHCSHEFEASMRANYEITKRFTAEFSIRACLTEHTGRTLERLRIWATDPNVHVRRLVSEGTRPRLPWAPRLRHFQRDPTPVLELLELLKDDPVEYVRRSVANNLNDIAKDHPELVVEVAARWWRDGDRNRRRLVRHGLRSLIKAGDPAALAVLGYGSDSPARVGGAKVLPNSVAIGSQVKIEVTIENPSAEPCGALVDIRVHFVKANGATSPKVFKGAELELGSHTVSTVRKTISLAQHSTRTHYPGEHAVEALVNGVAVPLGGFTVTV